MPSDIQPNGTGRPASGPGATSGANRKEPPETGHTGNARRITKGEADPLGDIVEKIYVCTDDYSIYSVVQAANDFARPRYCLNGDAAKCRAMRAKLTPIVKEITVMNDLVVVIYRSFLVGRRREVEWEGVRERTLNITARAMQLAFEDNAEEAEELLAKVQSETESRRDSKNRMRYILATLFALGAMLLVWGALDYGANYAAMVDRIGPRPAGFSDKWGAVYQMFQPNKDFSMVTAISLGALGAFFAVSFDIKAIRVHHAIREFEMFYSGFARILIGMIAAGVVVLLFDGRWILSGIEDGFRSPTIYLFAFLAGFSEYFVPNALKQVESAAKAAPPAAGKQ